jgi:hypothetical protein
MSIPVTSSSFNIRIIRSGIIVSATAIISIPVTAVITRPVGSISVVGITPSVGGIAPSVITSPAPSVRRIAVGEPHSPSRVAPSHADPPAVRTSGIPVHIGIVGIVVVPSVIAVREPPQTG